MIVQIIEYKIGWLRACPSIIIICIVGGKHLGVSIKILLVDCVCFEGLHDRHCMWRYFGVDPM